MRDLNTFLDSIDSDYLVLIEDATKIQAKGAVTELFTDKRHSEEPEGCVRPLACIIGCAWFAEDDANRCHAFWVCT